MMSRQIWIIVAVYLATGGMLVMADDAGSASHAKKVATCNCPQANGCAYAHPTTGPEEVMVMTANSGGGYSVDDMNMWSWDAIHVVISTAVNDNSALTSQVACIAHGKGKRFGFTVYLPDFVNKNVTDDDTSKWLDTTKSLQRLYYADHVVVDLTKMLGDVDKLNSSSLGKVEEFMTNMSKEQEFMGPRIYCIMPWSPPCVKEESDCITTRRILSHCNAVLMGPDSYVPDSKTGCIAKATIHIGKFMLGIDQYLNMLPSSKVVAGIPWHGYNYTCTSRDQSGKCVVGTSDQCDYTANRQKITFGEIQVLGHAFQNRSLTDRISQAVYYNSPKTPGYQIWYENIETLNLKYKLVKDLDLRGFAIWYGEDLKYGLDTNKLQFDRTMWGWVLHQIFVSADHRPVSKGHFFADTVAGVGVGCLLLGTALGVIFTCIALRRCDRNRSRLNRPFKLDDDDDDFRDDNHL